MNRQPRMRLALRSETVRALTASEVTLIAGARLGVTATEARNCERTGVVGHCEQPSRAIDCGSPTGGPPQRQVPRSFTLFLDGLGGSLPVRTRR